MIHASDHAAAMEFMVWARRASDKEKLHALDVELRFLADPLGGARVRTEENKGGGP